MKTKTLIEIAKINKDILKKPIILEVNDLISFILSQDKYEPKTIFGDQWPTTEHYDELVKFYQSTLRSRTFSEKDLNFALNRPKRKQIIDYAGDEIDIPNYIAQDPKCFITLESKPRKETLTILIEAIVTYNERSQKFMIDRQKEAYTIAVNAEAQGIPTKVYAYISITYREMPDPAHFFILIKDQLTPIYPAIWGLIANNEITNDLANLLSDYVLGTSTPGNGYPATTIYNQEIGETIHLIPKNGRIQIKTR